MQRNVMTKKNCLSVEAAVAKVQLGDNDLNSKTLFTINILQDLGSFSTNFIIVRNDEFKIKIKIKIHRKCFSVRENEEFFGNILFSDWNLQY